MNKFASANLPMARLDLSSINEYVRKKVEPFLNEILSTHGRTVSSFYIVGSAVTKDFNPMLSDINTLIVLNETNPEIFDFFALRGKRFGRRRIRAPLVMTRSYIEHSLEVFPIEFLEMQLINKLVYGEDILKGLRFEKTDLRLQCERELKSRLQTICQGYMKCLGSKYVLRNFFVGLFSGFIPVFRAILYLYNKELPKDTLGVLEELEQTTGISTQLFKELYKIKNQNLGLGLSELKKIFYDLVNFFDKVSIKIDEFKA
ncbi:MAG TPA: hypothetical protein ACFYD6_06645 [Candidatus Brocadiia bacterium]|nr:hypothetical protein [Candidatus Brocadiales bacterium]